MGGDGNEADIFGKGDSWELRREKWRVSQLFENGDGGGSFGPLLKMAPTHGGWPGARVRAIVRGV